MRYRVAYTREFSDALSDQIVYLTSEGVSQARIDDWLQRLLSLTDSLSELPRRFPLAELVSRTRGYAVHRLNVGDYAIFYRVDDAEGLVEILLLRHGRRRPWEGADH